MTVEKATTVILVFGFGNFLGLVLGGVAGSLLYRKGPRIPPLFAGVMSIVGCFPMWLMINFVYEATPNSVVTIISVLAGLCSGVTGPIVKSTLTNVTLPKTRGQAFALQTTFDDVGRGLGPVFVAMLISNLGGRTAAFNIAVFGWILCGAFNLLLFFTVERDEAAVQSRFAESLHRTCTTDIVRQSSAGTPNEQEDSDPLLCAKRRRHVSESLQTKGGVI
uniref:Major facilitator superfamily (MFS) profile domain-containing protein n=1 Tax=Minutocellus polymorphus TaxID=265543 RepID=A0A7S0FUK5_9STRA